MKTNSTDNKTLRIIAGATILLIVLMLAVGCAERTTEAVVTATNGTNGINGVDGTSCSVSETESGALITCSNGTSTFVQNGSNGNDGQNGQDGASCSVERVDGGAVVICGDTKAIINDGTNGGPVGSELIYAYDPCGDSPKVFNDEILFLGSKGRAYAYFEDNAASTPYEKQTRRISYLQPGSYRTTDSKENFCSFRVNSAENFPNIITNEVQN